MGGKEEGRNGGLHRERRGKVTERKGGTDGSWWRKLVRDWGWVNGGKERKWENTGKWLKFLREEIESRMEIWIRNNGREQAEENWSSC